MVRGTEKKSFKLTVKSWVSDEAELTACKKPLKRFDTASFTSRVA
jgi:hypothetical protein